MGSLAFIAFFFVFEWRLKKEKVSFGDREYLWFFTGLIFTALAGGWFTIESWSSIPSIWSVLDVRQPGVVSWGMLIGGALFLLFYVWQKKHTLKKGLKDREWQIYFGKLGDAIAPAIAIWIFIYRIGCHFWNDVPGTTTNVPWALYHVADETLRHPTAIYLSLSGLVIFIILMFFFKKKRFDSEVILWFLLIYTFNRFWIEFLRAYLTKFYGLNLPQLVAILVFCIILISLYRAYRYNQHLFLK